jgi:hypothetical protein
MVPALDFSPGERVFKPARTRHLAIAGFSIGLFSLVMMTS